MNDADGFALMLWIAVFGLVAVFVAIAIESVIGRADRQWVRRLRNIEDGRRAQRGEQ